MYVLNKCFIFKIVCLINIYAYLFTQECVYNNDIFVLNTQSRTQGVIYELVYKSWNRNKPYTNVKICFDSLLYRMSGYMWLTDTSLVEILYFPLQMSGGGLIKTGTS
jgi:hypothetical protein